MTTNSRDGRATTYVRIQIIEREGKYYFNMDFPDDLPKVMPKALPRTSVLVSRTKELSSDLTKNDQEILDLITRVRQECKNCGYAPVMGL